MILVKDMWTLSKYNFIYFVGIYKIMSLLNGTVLDTYYIFKAELLNM
jgi:hypothetical protein